MNKLEIYVDSNVEVCDEKLVILALRLGYRALVCKQVVDLDTSNTPELYRKVVLVSESVQDLKRQISSINSSSCFVTLIPRSVEVARWASHDTRIDTIMLTSNNIGVFDKKQFDTMSYYGKPLEISLKDISDTSLEVREKVFRRLNLLLRSKVGLIVGSGASSWNELYHPYTMVKILTSAFDIPPRVALLAITDCPRQIIAKKTPVRPSKQPLSRT